LQARDRLPNRSPTLQVPSIQQTAALALGRLANYSDDLAEAVVAHEILPQLVYSLGEQNVSFLANGSLTTHRLAGRSAFTRRLPRLCCEQWQSTRRSWPRLS
jgi:hypothetical protein